MITPRSLFGSAAVLAVLTSSLALAKPMRKPVAYEIGADTFEGVLVYDDAVKAPRPGVLLVPNWLGINEANLKQAEMVAGAQYVIFVADLYGKGKQPKNQAEAAKAAGAVRGDRKLMRARMNRSLETFLTAGKSVNLDAKKVGAIGFCFGGTAVIELARSGADVAGVVSFHGGLDAKLPSESKPKASILALHGAEDPSVAKEDLEAFKNDLRKVGADWVLVEFGGAVHSFTDVDANMPGRNMYDAKSAARAYEMMRDFFNERFSAK